MRYLSILLVVTFVCSCSWFKSEAKKVETALIDCAKTNLLQDVESSGVTLIAEVATLIAGGAVDWKQQLNALEAKVGPDALACAAKAAVAVFAIGQPAAPKPFEGGSPAARGAALIAERGWRFR